MSAGNELSQFDPESWTGSTSYVLDLVYDALSRHADVTKEGERRAVLEPKAASPYDAVFLCQNVYFAGAVQRLPIAGRCVLEFPTAGIRDNFMANQGVLLEVGPFHLERMFSVDGQPIPLPAADQSVADRSMAETGHVGIIEMASRGTTAVDHMRIVSMPSHEEWRRLFAGEIDVIPGLPVLYRSRFTGLGSVRIIELPPPGNIALFFNTARPPWTDPAMRREIARLINRHAVATLACGEPSCVAKITPQIVSGIRDDARAPAPLPPNALLPSRLSILVLSSHSPGLIAARAISYQIRQYHDIDITIEPLPIKDMEARRILGDFDLMIATMSFLSADRAGRISELLRHNAGYANEALTAALGQGDLIGAERILAEDMPVLPLYENRKFAAVDTRFCVDAPATQLSWAWLAKLYPCDGAVR